jgi:hypothetical protein
MKIISLLLLGVVCGSAAFAQTCASIPVGFNLAANGGRLGGFVPFPQSAYWHRNVSAMTPDSNSANYITNVGGTVGGGTLGWLGIYNANSPGVTPGVFYHVVSGAQPRVNVYFDVPQSVAYFTNGSTAVTWVSGAYLDALGSSASVASMVGDWYEGSTIAGTISSTGGCLSGSSNCTTAVLSSAFTGLTGNHAINNTSIASESDPGPMPIPSTPRVQNSLTSGNPYPNYISAQSTDAHVVVLDKDNCFLYELFDVGYDGHNIHAGTAATFDMLGGDDQRPVMWTSASVSGLPLFPGFLRDEELSGAVAINHPLATTAFVFCGSGNFFPHHSWIAPAEHHQYGGGTFNVQYWTQNELPIGSILRLKSSVNVSGYPSQAQLILNAMKAYGLIIVDGGCTLAHYGAANWNADQASIADLYVGGCSGCDPFNVSQFDVITTGNPVECDPEYATTGDNVPGNPHTPVCPNSTSNITGAVPVISGLTCTSGCANGHAVAGSQIRLSWALSGSTLSFVTPNVGATRNGFAVTTIQQTTTYTVSARNYYGPATPATITVVVP